MRHVTSEQFAGLYLIDKVDRPHSKEFRALVTDVSQPTGQVCGFCSTRYLSCFVRVLLGQDAQGERSCRVTRCPSCEGLNVVVVSLDNGEYFEVMRHPAQTGRPPAPPEVPSSIAKDYRESGAVLLVSPEASAALSRRCLQSILRDQGFNQHNLVQQIDAAIATQRLPPTVEEMLHYVRKIGNYAAHPSKSASTGEIMPVEPDEAEGNLEVLEALFEAYYVQPAKNRARLAKLQAKDQQAA